MKVCLVNISKSRLRYSELNLLFCCCITNTTSRSFVPYSAGSLPDCFSKLLTSHRLLTLGLPLEGNVTPHIYIWRPSSPLHFCNFISLTNYFLPSSSSALENHHQLCNRAGNSCAARKIYLGPQALPHLVAPCSHNCFRRNLEAPTWMGKSCLPPPERPTVVHSQVSSARIVVS